MLPFNQRQTPANRHAFCCFDVDLDPMPWHTILI